MIPSAVLEPFERKWQVKIIFEQGTTKVYLPPGNVDIVPLVAFLAEWDITHAIWWIGAGSPESPLEPALSPCPYCRGMHPAGSVEQCPLRPRRG
jgi:hypothetical protein